MNFWLGTGGATLHDYTTSTAASANSVRILHPRAYAQGPCPSAKILKLFTDKNFNGLADYAASAEGVNYLRWLTSTTPKRGAVGSNSRS